MITLGGLDRQRVRHALRQVALDLVAIRAAFRRYSCSLAGGLAELCLVWRLRIRIVRTALLPERRKTSIANAVVLQREYCDYITQGPPILLGPVAAKNAFVLRDRLHCRSFSIDA